MPFNNALAQSEFMEGRHKTLLVLDSYHEDELWGNSIVQPLSSVYLHTDSVRCEIMYLNCSAITDSASYKVVSDNVFSRYSERHPDCVVLVGNFAFNLRDRIKKEWGDIPFVLMSRSEGYGPLRDYFADEKSDLSLETRIPLSEARAEYNFTSVLVPDYYKATVDMMMSMIPEMEDFVFMSDESYVNRVAAFNIYNYMLEEYPKVNFNWLIASDANSDKMMSYLSVKNPKLGLLMSSWVYETESTRGFPVMTTKDLNLISTSVNPVFTIRKAYIEIGALGGVFTDHEIVMEHLFSVVEDMLNGKSMRDVPFYYPKTYAPLINYPQLVKYGFKAEDCPADTNFYMKPETYWERYWLVIIIIVILAIVSISLLMYSNMQQRKTITVLNRHIDFVDRMPIPYTNVKVKISDDDHLKSIEYGRHNKTCETLIKENALPDNPLHIIPEKTLVEKSKELIDTRNTVNFTYHLVPTNTYYNFLLFPLKISRAEDGSNEVDIDVFARNVTESYKLQMSLRKAAHLLDMTVDIAKIVPWQLDLKTKMLYIDKTSRVGRNADGSNVEEVMSLTQYLTNIHPEDEAQLSEMLNDVADGKVNDFRLQYRYKNSNNPDIYDWVEIRGAVTETDEYGNPSMITGSTITITEIKEHEEHLAQALSKANESDRLKSAFLANMSHEIRTPLNAIVGFSSMMAKIDDRQEREKLTSVINRNNDLLLSLINDVLDLAKIESNTIDITPSICDVNDVISSIAKTMAIRIPKGVKLNIVQYADKCVVETDSSRLSQLLINLLTNACKFTSKGHITVGYEIHEIDRMLYFFVKDSGIGISQENQDKIFNQFVKLNSFAQGTGLGLAICRSLVDKMGGEIGVKSKGEGYGSTFWFTLPYKPVDLGEIDEIEAAEIEAAKQKEQLEAIDNITTVVSDSEGDFIPVEDRLKVLVAEDNESNFWLLKHMIGHKYNLIEAKNGLQAVEFFKRHNPDFIIMDINMPEMDGYEATAEIRKISQTVPIIAVTAYAFASDRLRILNSGFNAYVAKPISEVTLNEAICNVLNK